MEAHCHCAFSKEIQEAIIACASAFLKKHFDFDVKGINFLADSHFFVLRVEEFVSRAELELAKKNRSLIDDMYSRVFYQTIQTLVQPLEQELSKKILSCRMQADVETGDCIITVTMSPERM